MMKTERIELSEVIEDIAAGPFGSKLKVSCFVDYGFPIIDGANLKGFTVTDNITKYVTDEKARSLHRSIAKRGDVVVTISGTLGQVAYIPDNSQFEEYLCSQRQFRVTFDKEKVYSPYIVFYLHTWEGQHKILAFANQTGVPALSQPLKNFKKIIIDLPSLEVQKKIASYCEILNEKIEENERINKNLEEQAQALFQEWFITNQASSNWKIGTFSDITESMIAGDWGKGSPQGNYTQQVYCIRGADIPEVKTGNKGKMPTRYILSRNYSTKHLVDGDVVIEASGGSPTQSTGRIAAISQSLLNRYDKGMVCTNFCKALKPKQGYSMFLYYYWQYLYNHNVFFSYENGTTGIKNLDISGFIETEPIVLPPSELVREFDDYCKRISDMTFANGLESEQLSILRDSLLPKLMSGEIDVSAIDL